MKLIIAEKQVNEMNQNNMTNEKKQNEIYIGIDEKSLSQIISPNTFNDKDCVCGFILGDDY